jgi:hypothetical protein
MGSSFVSWECGKRCGYGSLFRFAYLVKTLTASGSSRDGNGIEVQGFVGNGPV